MKLTPNQIVGLLETKDGNVCKRNYGRAIRIDCPVTSPVVIGRLHSMGLIEWQSKGRDDIAILTAAGEAALKANVDE